MNCENCGKEPRTPGIAKAYKEIRVGSTTAEERFHLCSSCSNDPEVDPREVWASAAIMYEVKA